MPGKTALSQLGTQKRRRSHGTPPWEVVAMARNGQFHHSKKRLVFVRKQVFGGDKRDRTADLLNAIQALSRLDRLHTPLNRANRAFNTRDTPPKAAKPSAFFLKFIIAGARPHINTKFENKLDTAIPFSHGIISLFHSERGC